MLFKYCDYFYALNMSLRYLHLLLIAPFLLLFGNCAQMLPLSGGKRDVLPPILMEAKPELLTKNFNSDLIVLKFNEFVQLKDLNNQMRICPRLQTDPEIVAGGKEVQIRLKKEELKPNTTYRLFLGKAIADMTESNSLNDFEYVFSTGNQIDSLSITGKVTDAFNNESESGVLVGLYSDSHGGDSLAFLQKPEYYTLSDENGNFNFKNLPKVSFKVIAIHDKNKNSVYDGESEKIAFLKSKIDLHSDTSVHLKLFQEEPVKAFIKKTGFSGNSTLLIIFNKPVGVKVAPLHEKNLVNVLQVNQTAHNDTISVFFKNITDTLSLIVTNPEFNTMDTLRLAIPTKKGNLKKFRSIELNTTSDFLDMNTDLFLHFSFWMDTLKWNDKGLYLEEKKDTSFIRQSLTGTWINENKFKVNYPFREGLSYHLKVDSNSFNTVNGIANDKLNFDFTVHQKSDYGTIRLKLRLNKKQAYIVQLLNEQNRVVKENYFQLSLSSSNDTSIDFTDVLPGNYKIKIVYDDNKNKKWDTGNLIKQELPEPVLLHSTQLKVVAEWEIEEVIQVKE